MNNIFRNYAIALTSPTAWIGMLIILGGILLWTKKQKLAKVFLTMGVALFVLFSFDPFTEFLLDKMENKYPGFTLELIKPSDKIKHVVVLAGGYIEQPDTHPLTTKLGRSTHVRVIEGIRIYREIPGSMLVFTGKGWAQLTEAEAMKNLAVSLGVNPQDIITEKESTNTIDHTIYLKDIIKDEKFVLVTSALHMPRSMGLFLKAGYHPIPAPTGHLLTGKYELFNMKVPFPVGENLQAADMLFNEYAAIFLAKLKGRI